MVKSREAPERSPASPFGAFPSIQNYESCDARLLRAVRWSQLFLQTSVEQIKIFDTIFSLIFFRSYLQFKLIPLKIPVNPVLTNRADINYHFISDGYPTALCQIWSCIAEYILANSI